MAVSGAPSKTGDAKWTPFFSLLREPDELRRPRASTSIFATSSSPSKILRMCSLICRVAELVLEHVLELPAERERAPAEVGLEDLTDVHAARNAERVEHDVDRATVLQVRHVLFRQDAGDDALVAVATGHLVADLELALDGDVDLHHLDHARRQLVALGEAIDLVAEVLFADADDLLELARASLAMSSASLDRDLAPVLARDLVERASSMLCALLEEDLALVVDELAGRRLADELLADAGGRTSRGGSSTSSSRVLLEAGAARGPRCRCARSSFSVPLRAKMRALMTMPPTPGGTRERAVTDVAGLLAEDRAEELLFGRELGLALRRDLADEDVARLHLGADADDAALVEVLEGLFADVRDVARDLFLAELGVAGDALELLDVDRGEDVVLGDALGDEDRVLEVVALPRHERDEHVLAERELAHVGRRAVGEDVAGLHRLAGADDRLLVVAGRLVRALELRRAW